LIIIFFFPIIKVVARGVGMRFAVTFIFLFFSFIHIEANNIQVLEDGPVHEAFVTQEFGEIILQAVPDKPPPPITEEMPRSIDDQSLWIPGYWSWSRDVGDYIWISGVWRRPPPGLQWVPGRWKNYQYGWVWMRGFWNKIPESEFEYISQAPPDPIDEKLITPPAPADSFFWVPGFWEWQSDSKEYRWLSGRWDLLGQHLLYIPAQYYWREKGYLLVPGYWDWPIENRGVAFANVSIPAEDRELVVFEPSVTLNPLYIMEKLFPFWPNYPSLFRYHFFYHFDLWVSWGAIPPWWQWYTWWSLPVQDTWWLWWWWSHPGYPNPTWIDSELAKKIPPPSDLVLKMMKDIQPPATVTPNGTIGSYELIKAIEKATGKNNPILSSDPKQVQQVQDLADPKIPKPPFLKPTGPKKIDTIPLKPNTDSSVSTMKMHPGRVKLPPRPVEEHQMIIAPDAPPKLTPPEDSEKKKTQQPNSEEPNPFKPPQNTASNTPVHTPYYLPKSSLPVTQIPQTTNPPAHTPSYSPNAYQSEGDYQGTPPLPPERHETPVQGYQPKYQYPQRQLQTQHLDHLMTEPQPQENPAGPKAHQLPGDESTLPDW